MESEATYPEFKAVNFQCNSCKRTHVFYLEEFYAAHPSLSGHGMDEVARRMRCTACGDKNASAYLFMGPECLEDSDEWNPESWSEFEYEKWKESYWGQVEEEEWDGVAWSEGVARSEDEYLSALFADELPP